MLDYIFKKQKKSSFKETLASSHSLATSAAATTAKKRKRINISYLGLSDDTRRQVTRVIRCLDSARLENESNSYESEIVAAKVSDQYNQRTTHLIVDFKRLFESGVDGDEEKQVSLLGLHERCVLLLAALSRCKIVRYQWLKKSQQKMRWLDESNYLVENFLDDDLSAYDNGSFVVKFIGKESSLFKGE